MVDSVGRVGQKLSCKLHLADAVMNKCKQTKIKASALFFVNKEALTTAFNFHRPLPVPMQHCGIRMKNLVLVHSSARGKHHCTAASICSRPPPPNKTAGAAATATTTPAPVDATPEPETPASGFSCSGDAGILSGNGKTCCPSSCSRCGGEGCGELGDHCCQGKIAASTDYCSVTNAAPCIVDGEIYTKYALLCR